MPDAPEVHALMLELRNLDDLGMALDPLDEGIFDRRAELPRGREELVRRQLLIPKEQHEMIEQRAPKLRDRFRAERSAEIDGADLGPEGAGDRIDADIVGRTQRGASRYQPCEGTVRDAGLCRKRS